MDGRTCGSARGREAMKDQMFACDHYISIDDNILFQCTQCCKCCANLSFLDMLLISWTLKRVVLGRKCKYLDGFACTIYKDRPKLCREWECGIIYGHGK